MTPRERAEEIAEEQLKTWPTDAPFGILRTAIKNDLMVPTIERALAMSTDIHTPGEYDHPHMTIGSASAVVKGLVDQLSAAKAIAREWEVKCDNRVAALEQRDRRIADLEAVLHRARYALQYERRHDNVLLPGHKWGDRLEFLAEIDAAIAAPASRIPAQTITSPARAGIQEEGPATATATKEPCLCGCPVEVHGAYGCECGCAWGRCEGMDVPMPKTPCVHDAPGVNLDTHKDGSK